MKPEIEQCNRRKALKAIQTADEYLVITAEGIKTKIAYEGGRGLVSAIATALDSEPELRTIYNAAVLLVVMNK